MRGAAGVGGGRSGVTSGGGRCGGGGSCGGDMQTTSAPFAQWSPVSVSVEGLQVWIFPSGAIEYHWKQLPCPLCRSKHHSGGSRARVLLMAGSELHDVGGLLGGEGIIGGGG